MSRKIKVSAVSYLNTKPLLYGIEQHKVRERISLDLEYPALIAQHLSEDRTDIGLVSTAALLTVPNAKIISNYGIAASGKVASVCIYSKVPLDQVETIYLDYQSRTSVKLAEILLKRYWGLRIELVNAPQNFIDLIDGSTAGVIIGDRALKANHDFEYIYDLAEHWKLHTGLDFIFAAWIANKDIPQELAADFDAANAAGLEHIDTVVAQTPFPYYDLNIYYKENIRYQFDESKLKGLDLFLEWIKE